MRLGRKPPTRGLSSAGKASRAALKQHFNHCSGNRFSAQQTGFYLCTSPLGCASCRRLAGPFTRRHRQTRLCGLRAAVSRLPPRCGYPPRNCSPSASGAGSVPSLGAPTTAVTTQRRNAMTPQPFAEHQTNSPKCRHFQCSRESSPRGPVPALCPPQVVGIHRPAPQTCIEND